MRMQWIPCAVALLVGGSLSAGCNENKAPTPAENAASAQKKISDIQNDPNLPPAAKENIIRNMQQQQATAQARGQASGASQASAARPGENAPKTQ